MKDEKFNVPTHMHILDIFGQLEIEDKLERSLVPV